MVKDNCVAAMKYHDIYVVQFNIPTQEKKRKSSKKSAPVAKEACVTKEPEVDTTSSDHGVSDLVLKAVEMTKVLPAFNGIDVNLPYFIQSNFSITNDGNLLYSGKPFSKNVNIDEIDKYKQKS